MSVKWKLTLNLLHLAGLWKLANFVIFVWVSDGESDGEIV